MDLRECSFPNCYNEHEALGYCKVHYNQLRRTGEVFEIKYRTPEKLNLQERIELHSHEDGECKIWDGSIDSRGFGKIKYQNRWYAPHRVMYEEEFGPFDDRLEQTCDNKRCWNPEHQSALVKS